jgi:ABC-type phosphate transport system auxiliary subunit
MLSAGQSQVPGRAFDPLAYVKRMETVGFTRQQAEALAEEQAKLVDEKLATKLDIETVHAKIETSRNELTAKIETSKNELKASIATLDAKIETVHAQLEASIVALDAKVETVHAQLEANSATVRAELVGKIAEVHVKISESRNATIRWMVGMVGGQTVALLAAMFGIMRLGGH